MNRGNGGVYLRPGELYISNRPTVVRTVLGSCVAVTMFDPILELAAICHVLLPRNERPSEKNCFLFADCSIPWMIEKFRQAGSKKQDIEVKMFGGADVLALAGKSSLVTVGKQNVREALRLIEEEGLLLLARDVGGKKGRKIFFYTHSGEVVVKRLIDEYPSFQGEVAEQGIVLKGFRQ